jgi:hypothetical protein
MLIHDGENDAGPQADTAQEPAADFARRRVLAELGRERPMGDQEDTTYRKEKVLLELLRASKDAFFVFRLPSCEITTYHLLRKRPAFRAIIFGMKKMPRRWVSPANISSRFLGRMS